MTLNLKLNHKPDNSVAVAEMIDRHVRCDVSGLIRALPMDTDYQHLFHTDLTIREMRACVADAGCELVHVNKIGNHWAWRGPNIYRPAFLTETFALADCIATNNLDPAQFAREPKQWLAVSDWLRDALREHGETVRNFPAGLTPEASAKEVLNIWLRCTAGEMVGDIALRSVWETAG